MRDEACNMRLVGQTDLNGHGDCMHVNLKEGFAFVGHMGESRVGTSVVDVSDPSRPRVVTQLETPPGTHSHKVQVVGDVLLVNYERSPFESQVSTATHTALPVPGRDLRVVTDEQLAQDCQGMQTRVRVVDISDERRPHVVSEFPAPEGDYCLRGGRFGPH